MGVHPGQWCPASAQLCGHASHLGFEGTCDDPHGRLRLFLAIQEFPSPSHLSPKTSFLPFLTHPRILDTRIRVSIPQQLPLPGSATRRVRLSLYPGYQVPTGSHQVLRRDGLYGTVYRALRDSFELYGYLPVWLRKVEAGSRDPSDWSNPNWSNRGGAAKGISRPGRGGAAAGMEGRQSPTPGRTRRAPGRGCAGGRTAFSTRSSTQATEVGCANTLVLSSMSRSGSHDDPPLAHLLL